MNDLSRRTGDQNNSNLGSKLERRKKKGWGGGTEAQNMHVCVPFDCWTREGGDVGTTPKGSINYTVHKLTHDNLLQCCLQDGPGPDKPERCQQI